MIRGWHPWLLLPLLLTAVLCLGQEGDAPQPLVGGNAQNPAAFNKPAAGQVVDSVTGQPISRALVQSGSGSAMLTDHDGRFVLEHATGLSVRKPGYFDDQTAHLGDGSWLLKLAPEAIFYGTVTDANSQPIQNLQVHLRRLEVHNGLNYWQETNGTITNAEGEFRFAELPAGKYSLSTGFMIDGLADAGASLGFVPVLYPQPGSGAADSGPDNALAGILLHAGDHVQANLSPPQEKLYPVSGAIRGPYERGAAFSVETLDHLPVSPSVRMFPGGLFRLRLPVGSYRLKAVTVVGDQQFTGTREITVGPAGLEAVPIELSAHVTVPIELDVEHGGSSQTTADPGFVNLSLVNQDPGNPPVAFPSQPRGGRNGPYTPGPGNPLVIYSVPPGRYLLQANMTPPWYVASASCGSLDLVRELLLIGESSGVCSLHAVLRDDSASLRWTVYSPQQSPAVMAIPLGNLLQDVSNANDMTGSENGLATGTISGLAPGRYLVIAMTHRLDIPFRDPQALEKYLSWGKQITLSANDNSEIELVMASGDE